MAINDQLEKKNRQDLGPKWRRRTGDDIDQLIGDGSLATPIVLHLEGANHVLCVLGGVVHCVAARQGGLIK